MAQQGLTRRATVMATLGVMAPWPSSEAVAVAAQAASSAASDGRVSVRTYGARGDGVTDDTSAFTSALADTGIAYVPAGHYRIGALGTGEYQKPLHVQGAGADTIIILDQRQRPALRIGAVGGEFGDVRAPTIIELMTFKRLADVVASYSYTAIDIHAAHPYTVRDLVMLNLGPDALKLTSCYYGSIHGISLANSGLTLNDVNNCSITASDIRPDEFSDSSRGAILFGQQGRYPVTLTDSDKAMFVATVIEGWECPVLLLQRSCNTVLSGCWLEGLISPTHVIRWEDARSLEIVDSWLDFSIPYKGCFIEIDNASQRQDISQIRIRGGTLTASSRSFGDAGKIVKVVGNEKVHVLVEGLTLVGGCLHGDRTVEFDIRSIVLSGPLRHYIHSVPNARMERERNSWMPESANRDWDFQRVGFVSAAEGLTIARTSTAGEFLTGSAGVRISGFGKGTKKAVRCPTAGRMTAVDREGQSYLAFVRLKCDHEATVTVEINGGFQNFAAAPAIDVPAGTWRDILFKTQEDVTWAQGRFRAPDIVIHVESRSKTPVSLYVDRVDYMVAAGDYAV